VTDGLHIWRSLLDFRDRGFTVIPHISPLPNTKSFTDQAFLTFREYLLLIAASIQEVLYGQRVPQANNPELVNLVQLAKQYAQQRRFPKMLLSNPDWPVSGKVKFWDNKLHRGLLDL
jgi:hypothetical protein